MANTTRPNLLFLLFDHQLYYRHGWDGGPVIQRPSFDRLCRDGVLFEQAYSVCPLCGPARRSMLTGLLPSVHGETRNDREMPWQTDAYLDILARSGYQCSYFGKWHAGPGTAFDHGCDGMNYPSYNNPYTKPEYRAYLDEMGLPFPEVEVEQVFWGDAKPGDTYRQLGNWCNEHYSGILKTPKETHEAYFLAHLACERLRVIAAGNQDTPFHLRVDFWGPHQPYFPSQDFADLYNPADIPVYGNFADDLSTKPAVYRTEGNLHISENTQLITPNPLPWPVWQQVLARAYAQQTLCDAAAGMILDTLRETGLDQNTLIVWTADHGDALACHGGHFDKRSYMPEEVLRVPMLLSWPGKLPGGAKSTRIASNLDVPTTLLNAAGLQFETPVQGRNLLKAADPSAPWDNCTVCQTHGHGENVIGRALITGHTKYIHTAGQLPELYDLSTDPYELTNLALSPEFDALRQEMHEKLIVYCRKTQDLEFLTAIEA